MTSNQNLKEVYSLISDIGGTNTRIQLIKFTKKSKKPIEVKTVFYKTRDFISFANVLRDFLTEYKDTGIWPHNAALAIAGAPYQNKLSMVNSLWPEIDGNALEREFNISPFCLINDFEAIGYFFLKPVENFITIYDVPRKEGGTIAVLGTGSGIGECILHSQIKSDGNFQYYVYPTEGSNKDFVAITQLDWDYREYCL